MRASVRFFLVVVFLIGGTSRLVADENLVFSTHHLNRFDGTQVHYHLSRIGQAPRPLLFIAQGSGCSSVRSNPHVPPVARIEPQAAVLLVEKAGVEPGRDPADCPAAFYQQDSLDQRVLDALLVIARLRQEDWWNGELILFGGSEGGAVVSFLAPLLPETRALIVFSSASSLTIGQSILQAVPPPARARMKEQFPLIRLQPSKDKVFGGHSHH